MDVKTRNIVGVFAEEFLRWGVSGGRVHDYSESSRVVYNTAIFKTFDVGAARSGFVAENKIESQGAWRSLRLVERILVVRRRFFDRSQPRFDGH